MATQGIGGGSGSGVGKEEGEGWPSYRIQKLLAPDTQWGMSRVKGDVKDTGMLRVHGKSPVLILRKNLSRERRE